MSQLQTGLGSAVMTSQEAAAFLGYTYNNFVSSYKEWGIPSERVAGRTMFYREDIEKFAAGRRPEKYGMHTRWSLPKREAA